MSNEIDRETWMPGWHLRERFWQSVLKDHHYCVVCGEVGTWVWEQLGEEGRPVAWIFVCKPHFNSIVRSNDDPNAIKYVIPEEERQKYEETSAIWRMKSSTGRQLICAICGRNTRWGRNVGEVRLCDEHWTFRNRWRIRFDRK